MTLIKRKALWTGPSLLADLGLDQAMLTRPIAPVEAVKVYPGHVTPGDLFVVRVSPPNRDAPEGPPDHKTAVSKALFNGAVAAITDEDLTGFAQDSPILKVPNLLDAHVKLGTIGRARMAGPLIGITGSIGKTTTKDLLHQTLSFFGPSSKTAGNLNGMVGLTSTLASLSADHAYGVVELAVTHPDGMAKNATMALPDVGILTTIGDAHLANFQSREHLFREKAVLLQHVRGNLPVLVGQSAVALDSGKLLSRLSRDVLSVGDQAQNDVQLLSTRLDVHNTYARIRVGGQIRDVMVPASGIAYAVAACFVLGTVHVLGLDLDHAIAAMQSFQHPNLQRGTRWRLNIGSGFAEFLDDAQNSTPMTLEALVQYLDMRTARRKILVMGDMLDLGGDELAKHLDLAPMLRNSKLDHLVAIGPLAGALAEAVSDDIPTTVFDDLETSFAPVKAMVQAGDLIAVKGTGYMELARLRNRITPPARQVLVKSKWVIEDSFPAPLGH